MSRYPEDYDRFSNEFYESEGAYVLGGARSCNGSNAVIGGSVGAGIFLWGVIYLLYGLRLRSLKRLGKLSFSPKTAQGRAEILNVVFMLFLTVILLMGFAAMGYAVDTCKKYNKAANMFRDARSSEREAQHLYRSSQEKLDKVLIELILPSIAFGFLTIWIARAASTSQIAVFHSGLKTVTRFVLYFQCFIVAFLLILSGVALPAVLRSWKLFTYAAADDFYFSWENHQATARAFIWIYFILDFLYLCIVMYLTWNVNGLLQSLSLPWHETRAASQWTLTIISIFIPVATIITYALGAEYVVIFLSFVYFLEMYFAWVLALLPGFRFWREAWKIFPITPVKDVEASAAGAVPVMNEKAVDPSQAAPAPAAPQPAAETQPVTATQPEISEAPKPEATSAYAASRGV